ncbi:MAG: response regulator transcription factor [Bacteroidetes bacterium]|nr:response regulator transcription factor [Bacteroidota bacterium]
MSAKTATRIAICNKHRLLSRGLSSLIESFGGYTVLFETNTDKDLINKLERKIIPDILVLDVAVNGYSAIKKIHETYPKVKILVASEIVHPYAVNYMLKNGAAAYISIDSDDKAILKALNDISNKGYHYNKIASKQFFEDAHTNEVHELTKKQLEFLNMCCSELSYQEMADKTGVSLRTMDWHRDMMFARFNLTNRTDMVLFALKTGLVKI